MHTALNSPPPIKRKKTELIGILGGKVTGPVARFARQIAGQGYIAVAPSSYHEFTGPEALSYNAEDTDKGNEWKISKVRPPPTRHSTEYVHT